MMPTMYRIIIYTPNESKPSKYPILLDAEEEIVFATEQLKHICPESDQKENSCEGKRPYIYHTQLLDMNDCGRFVLLDEQIRRCQPTDSKDAASRETTRKFMRGDVVEVLDGDHLTLGIIVHIPHQYYNNLVEVTIDKPHLFYRFSVLLYKPNGRIVLEDMQPSRLLHSITLSADTQIAALRTESENICIKE